MNALAAFLVHPFFLAEDLVDGLGSGIVDSKDLGRLNNGVTFEVN